MSWFKHRPKPSDNRPTVHHQTGPITRNLWDQTKEKSKRSEEPLPGNSKETSTKKD